MGLATEPSSDSENRSEGKFDDVIFFGFQVVIVDDVVGADGVTDSGSLAVFRPSGHGRRS